MCTKYPAFTHTINFFKVTEGKFALYMELVEVDRLGNIRLDDLFMHSLYYS